VLRLAATDKSPLASSVCSAMRALEEAKALDTLALPEMLAGEGPKSTRWRLVFTSSSADLEGLRKGGPSKGGGKYFPITAVQSWSRGGHISNGVYLGHWAALQFDGPFRLAGKRLQFDFSSLKLKLLGLNLSFGLKPEGYTLPEQGKAFGALPFFLFAHADGELVVARGRSGGLALWAKATPSWALESGALALE